MGPTSNTVAIEIDASAHLISVARRVKRLRVEREYAAADCLQLALAIFSNFPDQHTFIVGCFSALQSQVDLRQTHVVQSNCAVV